MESPTVFTIDTTDKPGIMDTNVIFRLHGGGHGGIRMTLFNLGWALANNQHLRTGIRRQSAESFALWRQLFAAAWRWKLAGGLASDKNWRLWLFEILAAKAWTGRVSNSAIWRGGILI